MSENFRNNKMATLVEKVHKTPYEQINPRLPSLSQKGCTVLVTGGAAGIGHAISRAFAEASADRVIIVGRRPEAVTKGVASLRSELDSSFQGEIIGRVCELSDLASIDQLWDSFAGEGIEIDVVVLNAASFSKGKPLLELGVEALLEDYQVNVVSSYRFAQRLSKQNLGKKKHLVNVSTISIHKFDTAAHHLNYAASKNAAALLLQLLAREVSPDEIQILSFHPGAILTQPARDHGHDENSHPWDNENLPGRFAVWAASEEASFLHGRFVHAAWDVTELQSGKARSLIDDDPQLLRVGVKGL
ncbi:SDR family NAD(P)-dependent oxidoreductase [Aspergillus lucknowensis]|uniref:NAD(P)-binding protein n=1 Tax=Aspergillus lucknowensis TaxID=176173 RepID=A0ABR4LE44_9EURO